MKTLLFGGTGFLGQHIKCELEDKYDLVSVGSKDYDLLDYHQCEKAFQDIRPKNVVFAAGKSGGIYSNKNNPVDYWQASLLMNVHVWSMCHKYNVEKIVWVLPGCSYARNAVNPIEEISLFEGMPDIAPAPGSLSKLMCVTGAYSYKKQYGLRSAIVIPANAYGPHDHFSDPLNAHVIPAMFSKILKAKKENDVVRFWGSGIALRDFIFVSDIAKNVSCFIENDINFPSENPCLENVCNISTGKPTSIKELAETIIDIVGFKGEVIWETDKPEGPLKKVFSNERMKSLGLTCDVDIKTGLQKTYDWYLKNYG